MDIVQAFMFQHMRERNVLGCVMAHSTKRLVVTEVKSFSVAADDRWWKGLLEICTDL